MAQKWNAPAGGTARAESNTKPINSTSTGRAAEFAARALTTYLARYPEAQRAELRAWITRLAAEPKGAQ